MKQSTPQISQSANITKGAVHTVSTDTSTKVTHQVIVFQKPVSNVTNGKNEVILKNNDLTSIQFLNKYKQSQPNFLTASKSFYSKDLINKPIYTKTDSSTHTIAGTLQEIPKAPKNPEGYAFSNMFIGLFIVSLILFAWIKVSFNKYLNQIFSATVNYHESIKLFRDHNSLIDRVYFILNIIFTLSTGIFIYQVICFLGINTVGVQSFLLLLICFGIIISIYLFKFISSSVCGFIFDKHNAFAEYLHNAYMFFKINGLLLLPLVALIAYTDKKFHYIFIYIGLFEIFSLYLLSILRGTIIILKKDILLFYWILYLCTLEILPVFLVYRFITKLA